MADTNKDQADALALGIIVLAGAGHVSILPNENLEAGRVVLVAHPDVVDRFRKLTAKGGDHE